MEIEFNSGTLICNVVLDDTSLGDDGLYIGKGGLDGMLQFLGDAGGLDAKICLPGLYILLGCPSCN